MRLRSLACGLVALGLSAAQTSALSFNYSVGTDIDDGSNAGLQNTQTIVDPVGPLTSVEVSLNLAPVAAVGGWLGDLYAYLRHTDSSGTRTSILLNRIGRTAADPAGLGDGPAVNITLASGGSDIHLLSSISGGSLTGTFGADGRAIDPSIVTEADARTAGLDIFNGADPNGDWTLFIADLSGGNQYRLESWGLTLESGTSSSVPEMANTLPLLGLGVASLASLSFLSYFNRPRRSLA
jgi:hypothetical protein